MLGTGELDTPSSRPSVGSLASFPARIQPNLQRQYPQRVSPSRPKVRGTMEISAPAIQRQMVKCWFLFVHGETATVPRLDR